MISNPYTYTSSHGPSFSSIAVKLSDHIPSTEEGKTPAEAGKTRGGSFFDVMILFSGFNVHDACMHLRNAQKALEKKEKNAGVRMCKVWRRCQHTYLLQALGEQGRVWGMIDMQLSIVSKTKKTHNSRVRVTGARSTISIGGPIGPRWEAL